MKFKIQFLFLLALICWLAPGITAQTFTTLYPFTGGNDGGRPQAGLIVSGGILYGTANYGGSANNGTVFSMSTNGGNFTVLHTFSTLSSGNNSDGANPMTGLILTNGTLYGTTYAGGASGKGTVFSLGTNGANFTVLHAFSALTGGNNSDGAYPNGGLVVAGPMLYGTASQGGIAGKGVVFSVGTNGGNFIVLHAFSTLSNQNTNGDGAYPNGNLAFSGGTLFGACSSGGTNGVGSLFSLGTNGGGFTTLHAFSTESGSGYNADGASPAGNTTVAGGILYGTGVGGGTNGWGTVFAVGTNGSGFTVLHTFSTIGGGDGTYPVGGVLCWVTR